MNYIWFLMVTVSLVISIISGRAEYIMGAISDGTKNAVDTIIMMSGIMCFWCGIMKIIERSSIIDIIKRIMSPIIDFLFGKLEDNEKKHISMNLCANFLGMGNAATPEGIKAMEELDKNNKNPHKVSYKMCMLMVLNTTSVQLIPSTVMSLRAAAGGVAESIIIPIWITSLVSLFVSVIAVKIMFFRKGTKK